jgi:hypothetical protein
MTPSVTRCVLIVSQMCRTMVVSDCICWRVVTLPSHSLCSKDSKNEWTDSRFRDEYANEFYF